MTEIIERTIYEVNGQVFATKEDAHTYIRFAAARIKLIVMLDSSHIYFRETDSNEISDWIIEKWETIKSIMEGSL